MSEPRKFQRRTVLIKRQLQFKYVGLGFLSVLLASLIIGGDIYYNMYRLIENEAPALAQMASQFNGMILVKLLLYLVLMMLIFVFVSHRIAGPIFRFEKSAQAVGTGDLTHRVALRTGDELMELQGEFNAMTASLQARVQNDRALAERLAGQVEDIAQKLPDDAAAARADLAAVKAELQRLTQSFKI